MNRAIRLIDNAIYFILFGFDRRISNIICEQLLRKICATASKNFLEEDKIKTFLNLMVKLLVHFEFQSIGIKIYLAKRKITKCEERKAEFYFY